MSMGCLDWVHLNSDNNQVMQGICFAMVMGLRLYKRVRVIE